MSTNWSDPKVAERILRSFRVWAVVGCSSRPWRASYGVSRYLLSQGYGVVPINPREELIHGKLAYPDLRSVPADPRAPIEVVDLFRRSELVMPPVEEAIEIGAKAVWMQLEVWNEDAAQRAHEAGLLVVMNRCPAIDHPQMIGTRPPPTIRRARADEAAALTALALRSKAHWGYDAEFMARAAEEIVIRPEDVEAHEVWVMEDGTGDVIGFHRVIPEEPAVLEDLWLDPSAIGVGQGRMLWEHAAATARAGGATALELNADPNAVGFYERMGAEVIDETPSRIAEGRLLPRMRLDLRGNAPAGGVPIPGD